MASTSKSVMKSQRKKKLFAVEQFGGKCQLCGYDRCIDALEFHHIDPAKKEHSPSYVIFSRSWERAFKELEKCLLICSNCHREIHHQVRDLTNVQQFVLPTLVLICEGCKNEIHTKNPNQKYCGSRCQHIGQLKVSTVPTKEELSQLLQDKTPWTAIGKKYGVSDNTMRKWARKFELIV